MFSFLLYSKRLVRTLYWRHCSRLRNNAPEHEQWRNDHFHREDIAHSESGHYSTMDAGAGQVDPNQVPTQSPPGIIWNYLRSGLVKSWFVVRDLLGLSRRQYEFSASAAAYRSLVLPRWKPISATSKGSSSHTAPFPHDPIAVSISNFRHRWANQPKDAAVFRLLL